MTALPSSRPPRVCLVVGDFPSVGENTNRHGIGTQSEMIARAWISVGAEVHVLWYSTGAKFTGLAPIVPVCLHQVHIPPEHWVPGLAMLRSGVILAGALRRLDRQSRFDVIEAVNDEGNMLGCALLFRERFHLRLSTSLEQNLMFRIRAPTLEERASAVLSRLTLRYAHNLLTHSHAQLEAMRAELGADRRIANVPLGIVDPGVLPRCARQPLHVGYLGTLTPRKGIDVLLRAVKELRRDPGRVHVVAAGKHHGMPAGFASWEAWAELELGLAHGEVEFTGPLPDAALLKYWTSIDVAVIPSRWESFGLVAVEAMARGIPVVASAGGSLPEVVCDSGLLVPSGDHHELARTLLHLAESQDLQADLAARGRTRYEEMYTLNAFARRMTEYFFR